MMIFMIAVLILTPIYIYWRMRVASNERVKVASSLDAYLQEDQPEDIKRILVSAYHDSRDPFISVKIAYSFISKRNEPSFIESQKGIKHHLDSYSEEQKKAFNRQFAMIMLVNVKMAPITNFLVALVIAIVAFARILRSRLDRIPTYEEPKRDLAAYYYANEA
ncbi:hypothetical protein [Enterovibrio norvegicus]|uniref:Uncharacterized protein n=1 Tax=Enterovibrio norvegicus TaxID=188144 RepID=A0A2N7LA02_9GAMM|nr:hypothetical protein [Enterovibrio norvegicus]PMN91342.1 hypothetical protein BCT23_17690 [Enterovibrio norvegicus]